MHRLSAGCRTARRFVAPPRAGETGMCDLDSLGQPTSVGRGAASRALGSGERVWLSGSTAGRRVIGARMADVAASTRGW